MNRIEEAVEVGVTVQTSLETKGMAIPDLPLLSCSAHREGTGIDL
jgi:hypothetical protein